MADGSSHSWWSMTRHIIWHTRMPGSGDHPPYQNLSHIWNGPPGKDFFSSDSSPGNGAVICPAFERGVKPLALMKSATRVADQSDAL